MVESSRVEDNKVYISFLTPNTSDEHIREIFGHFGKVKSVEILSKEDKESKKYAVVDFENIDDAKNSVVHMNEGEIDGVRVRVGFKGP